MPPTLIPVQPPPKPDDRLLTSREVAEILNVDVSWVNNHCERIEPLLPFVPLGFGRGAKRRFRKVDILEFIENNLVRPRLRR